MRIEQQAQRRKGIVLTLADLASWRVKYFCQLPPLFSRGGGAILSAVQGVEDAKTGSSTGRRMQASPPGFCAARKSGYQR